MPPEMELVAEWFRLAADDLRVAELTLAADPPMLTSACFHCQQAAEKALKGFLQSTGPIPPKSHSLDYLLDLCEQHDSAFAGIRDTCAWLTEFGVGPRYPGFAPQPTASQASEALISARATVEFALRRLSDAARGADG